MLVMVGVVGMRLSLVCSYWLVSSSGGCVFLVVFIGVEVSWCSLVGVFFCRGVLLLCFFSGICMVILVCLCGSSGRVFSSKVSIVIYVSRLVSVGCWLCMVVFIL